MANTKISALPSATLPLTGTEPVPVVQGGATKQAPANAFGTLQGFAYDPATSDFENGIFGYTSGIVNANGSPTRISANTIDFSMQPDDTYSIILSSDSIIVSNSGRGSGTQKIHTLVVASGVITYDPATDDLRTWAQTDTTLANLAAEEAAKGTPTVIDPNNTITNESLTTGALTTGLDLEVCQHNVTSGGTAGDEEISIGGSFCPHQSMFINFANKSDPADVIVVADPADIFSLGSDTITAIEFDDEDERLWADFNDITAKYEIDPSRTTAGVVTSTALAPESLTVGASPYKYTNSSAYNQQVIIGNVAGLSAVKFQRGAGTQYAMATSVGQQIILCPGDNVEVTYAVTTPTMIAITFRS